MAGETKSNFVHRARFTFTKALTTFEHALVLHLICFEQKQPEVSAMSVFKDPRSDFGKSTFL